MLRAGIRWEKGGHGGGKISKTERKPVSGVA
jgi:hypothetical protein